MAILVKQDRPIKLRGGCTLDARAFCSPAAVTFFAATLLSTTAVAAAGVKTTTHRGPNKPPTVQVTCPDALDDGTLVDARLAKTLVEQAASLHWQGGYGLPNSCHLQVHLICGPDLDHDGDAEAIIEVDWWQALDGGDCAKLNSASDYWPVTYTFLAAKHQDAWRAVAPLGVGIFGDGEQMRRTASFVRISKREIGIMTSWSNVSSDNGCQIAGYETFAVRAGKLEKQSTRDESPPCTRCCDPP